MATVTFNKKTLERLIGKKLTLEQWDDRTSMLGAAFEGETADEITIEVFPNRPDLLSVEGFARAMRTFLGMKSGLATYKAQASDYVINVEPGVASVRPYTACAVVKGLKFDDASIKQLIQFQEKLHTTFCRNRKKAAIGIYPLEQIAWPITYTAKRPGDIVFQPLEAHKKISAKELVLNHPTGKVFAHLLADADRYPVFIDANDEVLSVPPIINSERTGRVKPSTKDIFIECSGFDQKFLHQLLNIIVASLADAGGKLHQVTVKYGTKKDVTPHLEPTTHTLDIAYANKILGITVDAKIAKRALEKLGHGVDGAQVHVPCYRADVLHQRDLVEDLAIGIGYDTIEPEIPRVATVAEENPQHVFQRRIADLLVGLGLLEANTFHLTSIVSQTSAVLADDLQVVELANSMTTDYNALRHMIFPSLLDVLKNNKHHDYPQKLFGMGTIFHHDKTVETGVREAQHLSIITTHAKADYTEIRQLIEYILTRLELPLTVKEGTSPSCIPGRSADLYIDKTKFAMMGELHPKVLRNWELEMPAAFVELNLDVLYSLVKK